MLRNRWPESIGTGGRNQSESATGIRRNPHEFEEDIRGLLLELHEHDADGQRFRYTETKDGEHALPEMRIDLRNLGHQFDRIEEYFNGLDGYMDALLTNRADVAAQFQGEVYP